MQTFIDCIVIYLVSICIFLSMLYNFGLCQKEINYKKIRYIDLKHDIFYIICEIHKLVQIKTIFWIHMIWLLFLDGVTLFQRNAILKGKRWHHMESILSCESSILSERIWGSYVRLTTNFKMFYF